MSVASVRATATDANPRNHCHADNDRGPHRSGPGRSTSNEEMMARLVFVSVCSLVAVGCTVNGSGSDNPWHAPASPSHANEGASEDNDPNGSGGEQDPDDESASGADDDSDTATATSADDPPDMPKWDIGEPPTGEVPQKQCDIDFLFVVDDSGSMGDEQAALAASVPEFVDTVVEVMELEKFHLAVTTTDAYQFNSAECATLGGFVVQTGELNQEPVSCGYVDGYNFMTQRDDLAMSFPCAAKVGTLGNGDEKPMEAMVNALTDIASPCTDSFLRDDALLVVVVITDEDDSPDGDSTPGNTGSAGTPESWRQAVVAAKGDVPERIVVLSLIGVDKPNLCVADWNPQAPLIGGAELNVTIKEFAESFGDNGFIGDICASSYGEFFDDAVSVIDLACDDLPG